MSTKENEKNEGKSLRKGCLIVLLVILIVVVVGGGIGWIFLSKEHREAANLPLNAVDFDRLSDGSLSWYLCWRNVQMAGERM